MLTLRHGWLCRLTLPAWFALLLLPLVGGGCATNEATPGRAGSGKAAALRQMRVLIYESAAPVTVAVGGAFRVVDPAGRSVSQSQAPLSLKISADARQPAAVWVNGQSLPAGSRIVPRTDGSLQVDTAEFSRRYYGTLTLLNRGGRLTIVNNLDIEQYLPGVLAGELPAKFHPEAFRAQAVAARTYALYQKFVHPRSDFDVQSTTASQMYVGFGGNTPLEARALEAVRATQGRVLTWSSPTGERIFCTYFSSTCGGETSNVSNLQPVASIPPLAGGVRCTSCTHGPRYRWDTVVFTRQQVTQKLRAAHPQAFAGMGTIERIEPAEVTPAGRVTWLRLYDAGGEAVRMRAAKFRLAMDPGVLRSTWFTIQPTADGFAFCNGRGFGHGVGMCQYGADGLGQAGWNWRQILAHYYPGSHITKAY